MNNPTTPKQKADEPVICDKFAASLGISGDGLNLDEISRTLGLTPTIARPKGGHKVTWNDQWVYQAPVLTRKSIHGPHWRYPELPANLSDRPDGCPAHFKARQRVTTDFATCFTIQRATIYAAQRSSYSSPLQTSSDSPICWPTRAEEYTY